MTLDDPTLEERRFTEAHDRILHALVEQVHALSGRVAALEARDVDVRDHVEVRPTAAPMTAEPSVSTGNGSPDTTPPRRHTGWQPTRR